MCPHVSLQDIRFGETLVTLLTSIRLLPTVWPHMSLQASRCRETLVSLLTNISLLPTVCHRMGGRCSRCRNGFTCRGCPQTTDNRKSQARGDHTCPQVLHQLRFLSGPHSLSYFLPSQPSSEILPDPWWNKKKYPWLKLKRLIKKYNEPLSSKIVMLLFMECLRNPKSLQKIFAQKLQYSVLSIDLIQFPDITPYKLYSTAQIV